MPKTIKPKHKKNEEVSEFEKRLFLNNIRPDPETHIKVNQSVCLLCKNRECTTFCPTSVFVWSESEEELFIAHESCIECGACKMGCPYESIEYSHPKSGYGVF